MISSEAGIVGYGSAAYHKKPQQPLFGYMAEAARAALTAANISPAEIDGLSVDGSLGSDTAVSAAEYLGLTVRWVNKSTAAGAGTLMAVVNAVRAVHQGQARTVLCIGAGAQDIAAFKRRVSSFTAVVSDYLAPHGYGGPPGMHAIIQRKHMERFGTTREQLGRIAVQQRLNARCNPAALLRKELSLEDYLNAKLVADPLRLFDCVLPCSGAEAIIVGALDRAPAGKGVRILSARELHNHLPGEVAPVEGGWAQFREALFDEAGYAPSDMHFMQCYDDFPIIAAMQIEDIGFCDKGEVGHFLDTNTLTWDGTFPFNTGGGQLSCGQAGGAAGLLSVVEAVRQLRGEGGERQVLKAARGVVTGYGMISYGHGLSASAAILEKAP
jgi:acetyl-CoA acetyltransferase